MPFHYLSHHLKSIQPLQFFSHFKTLQQQPSEQKIWIHLSTFQLQHAKSNLECVCTHACIIRIGIVLGEYCYIIYYKQRRRGGTSAGLSSHVLLNSGFAQIKSFAFEHFTMTSSNLEWFWVPISNLVMGISSFSNIQH